MFRATTVYLLLVLSLLGATTGCQLTEENRPVDEKTELSFAELLPTVLTQVAFNQSAIGGRGPAILMQVLDENDASIRPFSTYRLSPDLFNSYWNDGLYTGSLQPANQLLTKAQAENAPFYAAIARILLAHEWGQTTAAFGDIPFSEALKGNEYWQPRYDRQEDVYQGIQQLLDEAIDGLRNPTDGPTPGPDDLFFGGDREGWLKLAYALKARFLLHTTQRQPERFPEILAIVQNETFNNRSEQADFDWSRATTIDNPLYTFGVSRPSTVIIHDTFAARLMGTNDPRSDRIMAATPGEDWLYFQEGNEDLYWSQPDAVIPVVSFVEIKFMEAEALLSIGADPATVSQVLYDAIAASFQQMNIDPAPHATFISERADLSAFSDEADILEHLMQEAQVAYYGFAFQQIWNHYRRTGFPILIPPAGNLAWELNPSGAIPQRFLYPESERVYNTVHTQEAIDRQDGALLDTPVWVFE